MEKSLKNKAVKIQGRAYVLVKDRIIYFNETYPNGRIETSLLTEPTATQIVIKAVVYPDVKLETRFFTGYSQAVVGKGMVNATAALENAETSAVGRALAMMGIGLIDEVASADEMRKAQPAKAAVKPAVASPVTFTKTARMIAAQSDPKTLLEWAKRIEAAKSFTKEEKDQLIYRINAKLPSTAE